MKVTVSSLNGYAFCPRSVYLSDFLFVAPVNDSEKVRGFVGHGIRKELFLRQKGFIGKVHDAAEIGVLLRSELVDIVDRAPLVYAKKFPGVSLKACVSETASEVLDEVTLLLERLSCMSRDMGFDKAFGSLTPWEIDFPVSSDAIGLTGRIDLVMKGKNYYPLELKTCSPSDTLWEGDRLQVCAYSMLLEDALEIKNIPHGFVEYTRIHERRPVVNTEKLREKVFETRDAVLDVMGGTMPDICPHGNGRKCASCGFAERCYEM